MSSELAFSQSLVRAARILRSGGVVAYPTEGVFGLGCLPDEFQAVSRILAIKERDPAMGLVLIASDIAQLGTWVEIPQGSPSLESDDERPVTWVIPATDEVPYWIRGSHSGLAVRLTTHPVARALCVAADSALVSTSANLHGRAPARNRFVLRRRFGVLVDCIVPGECGPASGASEIRELASGRVLRSA
jgi:L-threonylcarbamoyladenylate synthase